MEKWQFDFEWLRIKHFIKDQIGRPELPDMNAILFLIGIQELGKGSIGKFTKEEKRDLMHIASCHLMSQEGYYEFKGLDHEGWPHYEQLKPFPIKGVEEQEDFLKGQIIKYFTNAYPNIFEN